MDTKANQIAAETGRLVIKKNDQYKITDGPNTSLLFDACKYAFSGSTITFSFTLDATHIKTRNFRIWSISHEDESGSSFYVRGMCEVNHRLFPGGTLYKTVKFEAYYDTRKRTGMLYFTEDSYA